MHWLALLTSSNFKLLFVLLPDIVSFLSVLRYGFMVISPGLVNFKRAEDCTFGLFRRVISVAISLHRGKAS